MSTSARERRTPPLCAWQGSSLCLCCAWGCAGQNSLIRDGARTRERHNTVCALQNPQQLRPNSVSACRSPQYQGRIAVTPDERPTNISAGSSVCSASHRRVNCGHDSDSDPRFRTHQASNGTLVHDRLVLVTEVTFTSRCDDLLACRDLSTRSALVVVVSFAPALFLRPLSAFVPGRFVCVTFPDFRTHRSFQTKPARPTSRNDARKQSFPARRHFTRNRLSRRTNGQYGYVAYYIKMEP